MRDFRVTDDIFTGPATDDWFDEATDVDRYLTDEEREHDEPDAIDRYLARLAQDDTDRTARLPSAA